MSYRRDIQALRGLAVIAVVLFHADEHFFANGFLGVDIFFVISGFVVTPLIIRIFTGDSNTVISQLKKFFVNRFHRLAPALGLAISISVLLIFFLGPIDDQHERIAPQGLATLLLLGNFGAYKFSGDYFSPNPNPFVHTWSLSVEEQIYIFLPIVLFFVLKKFRISRRTYAYTFLTIASLSLLSFCLPTMLQGFYSLGGIQIASQFSFYSPFDRMWQFCVGGLLFLHLDGSRNARGKANTALLHLIAVSTIGILFLNHDFDFRIGSLISTLLALLIIKTEALNKMPDILARPLIWLGDRSYSIYLFHMPIIYLAKYSHFFSIPSRSDFYLQEIVAVIMSLIVGSLSFTLVENRFRPRYSKRVRNRIEKNSVLAFIALPTVLLSALFLVSASGLFRDPNLPVPNKTSPWDWDTKCRIVQGDYNPDTTPCAYTVNTPDRSILLFGDSHAAVLSKSFVALARKENVNLYVLTYAGCPFRPAFPDLTSGCVLHNKAILRFLENHKIDTAFYSQRSPKVYVVPSSEKNRHELVNGTLSELDKVQSLVRKLVFVGVSPEYTPKNTVLASLLGIHGEFDLRAFMDNEILKVATRRTKIEYVDIYKLLCDQRNQCKTRMGNSWLFHDTNHLSIAGANLVTRQLSLN